MLETKKNPSTILTPSPTERAMGWRMGRDLVPLLVLVSGFLLVRKVLDLSGLMQLGYVLLALWLLKPRPQGRLYRYLYLHWPVNKVLVPLTGGKVWQYDSHHLKWFRRHAIPLTDFGIPQKSGEVLGAIYDKRHGIHSLVFRADGWSIPALSLEDQHQSQEALAAKIKELNGIVEGHSLGVSMVHARLPLNTPALATLMRELNHHDVNDWWDKHVHGVAGSDEGLSPDALCDKRLAQYQHGLLETSQKYANDLLATFVVSLYPDAELAKQLRGSKGYGKRKPKEWTDRKVHDLAISRLARSAEAKLLELGVVRPYCLNRDEVADYLRGWDLQLRSQYFAGALPVHRDNRLDKQHPHHHIMLWRDGSTGNLQVVLDGSHWAVFVLNKHDAFLSPEYYTLMRALPTRYCVFTLAGTTLRADKEVKGLEIGDTLLQDVRDKYRGNDKLGRKTQRRDDLREARADQLNESGYQLPYNVLVAVGGLNSAELENEARKVKDYLEGKSTDPQRLNDETVNLDYLMTALFGPNLL